MIITSTAGTPSSAAVLAALFAFSSFNTDIFVHGHGHMTSPRSRNWFAAEAGVDGQSMPNLPPKEYCPHCLNLNEGVCGKTNGGRSFDDWVDSEGNAMPWISQDIYTEGQEVLIKSYLDTHHNGHMVVSACADGPASTQECFDTPGNQLMFVRDELYGMPLDPNYPERGYYAGGQGGGIKDFEMHFKLPDGISGDQVMLQWKYITANSCSPLGYSTYFATNSLPSTYWTPGLGECAETLPNDGSRSEVWPEMFFNCGEVKIEPSAPTVSPVPTASPVVPPPTESTTTTTTTASGCCSTDFANCIDSSNSCAASQSQCENCGGHHWISGPQTGCKALWHGSCAGGSDSCCQGLTCVEDVNNTPDNPYNQCQYIESAPTTTTTTTTTSSTSTTTTTTTTVQAGCYSNDYKHCNHPDFDAAGDSCTTAWLPDGEPSDGCVALWGDCGADGNCCGPATCFGDDQTTGGERRCVVPTNEEPPPTTTTTTTTTLADPATTTTTTTCTDCDDVVTAYIGGGLTCEELATEANCRFDDNWIENRFCRSQCYVNGFGYGGDVCCGAAAPSRFLRARFAY